MYNTHQMCNTYAEGYEISMETLLKSYKSAGTQFHGTQIIYTLMTTHLGWSPGILYLGVIGV